MLTPTQEKGRCPRAAGAVPILVDYQMLGRGRLTWKAVLSLTPWHPSSLQQRAWKLAMPECGSSPGHANY